MEAGNVKKDAPKILIVDDIDINVEILDNILSYEGYETLCALNVQDAISIIRTTLPSLILSDLSMPGVDGLEFCRMLKSDPRTRDIPFIFITVLNSGEEKENAFKAGAVDYIPKPFDAVEVIMRVNNHLSSYKMKQNMHDYNRRMHKLVEDQKKQIELEQKNIMLALAEIMEKRNADMRTHIRNVGYNCRLLAQGLQFLPEYENKISDDFIESIETAARLHNVGSLVIPEHIRPWNGGAHERDKEYIEKIVEEGAGILEKICAGNNGGGLLMMAVNIARYHHCNWDGTGYPELKGRDIPLEARITLLANDFDMLTAGNNDGARLSMEDIMSRINEQDGRVYDPDVVKVFNKIWKQMKKG